MNRETPAVLRHVRALFGAGAAGGATDGQLLERVTSSEADPEAAEAAFAVLVARHGPMVLGVCRRVLRDSNDADDAFQATFLVLVRKAHSVRVDGSLGRWLYGVSRRVAARARSDATRRQAREAKAASPETIEDDPDRSELLAALDAEVSRLPEPFRSAVLLCDLGGLTHEDAARQFGCPVGTVESRLSRGRKRLRERLTRRGFVQSVALCPPPAVPEALSVSTIQAAARSGAVPAAITSLIEGVIHDMLWTKLKTLALGLAAVVVLGGVGVVAAERLKADDTPKPKAETAKPAIKLQRARRMEPGDWLVVEVLQSIQGRPIVGERLVRPDGTISLGFYGDLKVVGLTRQEIKVKVVEHLRKYLDDRDLGLVTEDKDGNKIKVSPAETSSVFVDDSINDDHSLVGYKTPVKIPITPANILVAERPAPIKPGGKVTIEVLQALEGRPISGERMVRSDGTISLGFYGDLQVAGLDRNAIKVQVVEHLRKYLNDRDLGLDVVDPKTGKSVKIAPADTLNVYVDDSVIPKLRSSVDGHQPKTMDNRLDELDRKLDRLIQAVEGLSKAR